MALQPIDRTLLVTRNVALACFGITATLVALYAVSVFSDIIPSQVSSDMASACLYGSIGLGTLTLILGLSYYIKKSHIIKLKTSATTALPASSLSSDPRTQLPPARVPVNQVKFNEPEANESIIEEYEKKASRISLEIKGLEEIAALPNLDSDQREQAKAYLNKKRTELDYVNGEIYQLRKALGMAPQNRRLYSSSISSGGSRRQEEGKEATPIKASLNQEQLRAARLKAFETLLAPSPSSKGVPTSSKEASGQEERRLARRRDILRSASDRVSSSSAPKAKVSLIPVALPTATQPGEKTRERFEYLEQVREIYRKNNHQRICELVESCDDDAQEKEKARSYLKEINQNSIEWVNLYQHFQRDILSHAREIGVFV